MKTSEIYKFTNYLRTEHQILIDEKIITGYLDKRDEIRITADAIIDIVCRYFSIDYIQIIGGSRKDEIKIPRQIACYFVRKNTNLSLVQIGAKLLIDHSTVLHSVRVVNNMMETDKKYFENIKKLEGLIK